MGHPSPSHQWDIRRRSLFLLTPPWAKGTNMNPRELHRPLVLHSQAGWVRAWVEVEVKVEGRAHKLGLQRPKGMSTPSHLRLSLQINLSFRVHFYSFSYG